MKTSLIAFLALNLFLSIPLAANAAEALTPLTAVASSEEKVETKARNAVDGDMATRWSSQFSDPQTLEIDMGKKSRLGGVILKWEPAHAAQYRIDIFMESEGQSQGVWKTVFEENACDGGTDYVFFTPVETQKFRILGTKRATTWGYSLFEVLPLTPDKIPTASSLNQEDSSPAANAIDGNRKTAWRGKFSDNSLIFDMHEIGPVGGIFIQWGGKYPADYSVEVSKDGKTFQKVFETKTANGGLDKVYFEAVKAQKIRILTHGGSYEIREVFFKGEDEQLTPQKYFEVLAGDAPKGFYPRWLSKEQGYWTVVGVPGDDMESLLGEDGTLEPLAEGFSVSPFVILKTGILNYANVEVSQSLEEGYLPIPSVTWRKEGLELVTTAFAAGTPGKTATYVRHRIKNKKKEPVEGNICFAIRPLQINPPWQAGGISNISSLDFIHENSTFRINGIERIMLGEQPEKAGTINHQEGDITEKMRAGEIPEILNAKDPKGLASGAWCYAFSLKPGTETSFYSAYPLNHGTLRPDPKAFKKLKKENAAMWIEKLNRFEIQIPEKKLVDIMRSNLAYILINKDGPSLQPGSRYYERSWMRDGATTSLALVEGGLKEEVREFLDWYSTYAEADGEIPAIISTLEGARDRIREYDSQGEFIFAVLKYYQYSGDKEWLVRNYPLVKKALEYLDKLRQKRTAEFYKRPDQKRFYGILPPSVSHEGYFPEPGKHSYWDDFWAMRGWKDGEEIARIVGDEASLPWMKDQEQSLRRGVLDSIEAVGRLKKINFIPGCAELGDFDATSTAIAVFPAEEFRFLPEEKLRRTFNLYINDLRRRKTAGWSGSFTPYELRTMGAMMLMGRKKEAQEMLRYFPTVTRPEGWNHWAEVVFGNPRLAQYLGDMPHTWVGSEYIHAFRSFFVYETEGKIHLGAGLDPNWLDAKDGVFVRLPTIYGEVQYRVSRTADGRAHVLAEGSAAPPEGFVFHSPFFNQIQEFKSLPQEFDIA